MAGNTLLYYYQDEQIFMDWIALFQVSRQETIATSIRYKYVTKHSTCVGSYLSSTAIVQELMKPIYLRNNYPLLKPSTQFL